MTYIEFKKEILKIENKQLDNLSYFEKYRSNFLNSNIFERLFLYSSMYEYLFLNKSKENGAFYTNFDIAYEMIKIIFKKDNKFEWKKILDPAVWTWIFIFAFIKYLSNDLKYDTESINKILKNTYTFDIDNNSSDFFLFLLKEVLKYSYKNHKVKSFFSENNKYDYIIGNPPYWVCLNKEKDILINEYKLNKNEVSNDSYGLFYIKAYSLLNNSWKICFITPNSFLNIKNHYWLRKTLINDIDLIILLNKDVFKNKFTKLQPWIETVICLIKKNSIEKDINIINNIDLKYDFNVWIKIDFNNINKVNKDKIKNIYHMPISYFYTKEILDLLSNKKIKKVKDYFNSAMWIKTSDNNKYVSKVKTNKFKDIFIKWTSKEKQSYKYKLFDYIDIKSLIIDNPKNSNIPKDYFLDKNKKKIWIPEIWHKWIITAFEYKNEYVSNSIWIYVPKDEFFNDSFFEKSLNIFNSELYKLFSKIYSNNIRLEKHIIDNLPFYI